MVTIKAFTDITQSKKLAEFLPHESADMCYLNEDSSFPKVIYNGMAFFNSKEESPSTIIFCWSLGALLEILPKTVNTETLFIETSATLWHVGYRNVHTAIETYLIDACYELIIKLKELYNYDTRRKSKSL